jgi:release factor glutamine methyltransferase
MIGRSRSIALFEQFILPGAARGEPVSRIIGQRDFYGRCFEVTPDVLDPRADTETLIDAVLPLVPGSARTAASLISEPVRVPSSSPCWRSCLLARGVATDKSEAALAVARRNAVSSSG